MTRAQIVVMIVGWTVVIGVSILTTLVFAVIKSAEKDSRKLKDGADNDITPHNGVATKLRTNTTKLVMLGDQFDSSNPHNGGVLADIPGKYYDKTTGKITPAGKVWDKTTQEFEDSTSAPKENELHKHKINQAPIGFRWLARFFGVYWVSIIPNQRRHTYKERFTWPVTEVKEGQITERDIRIRSEITPVIFAQRTYPRTFLKVELKSKVTINVTAVFTIEVIDPAKLIFELGKDWLELLFEIIEGEIAEIYGEIEWSPENNQTTLPLIDGFGERIIKGKGGQSGINSRPQTRGIVHIVGASFSSYELSGVHVDVQKALDEQAIAKIKVGTAKHRAEAMAAEAEGKSADERAVAQTLTEVFGSEAAANILANRAQPGMLGKVNITTNGKAQP